MWDAHSALTLVHSALSMSTAKNRHDCLSLINHKTFFWESYPNFDFKSKSSFPDQA